ncbi:hypothetical protein ABZZ37_27105 [Streptomyces sp. NPDC006464]|uniref:hypothetical protein n=1 Tax=unclassified Streptomyces TaxID=2593676 RepID=UPI0033AB97CD
METARVFFGLAAPLVVSWERDWFRDRPWPAILLTLAYGGYAIAPYRHETKPWIALAAAGLLALGAAILLHRPGTLSPGFSVTTPVTLGPMSGARKSGAFVIGLAGLIGLWAAAPTTVDLGNRLLLSDRVTVMFSAMLLAVFGGGSLVKAATDPVEREIHALAAGPAKTMALQLIDSGGRNIGLFERGILFLFLAAGQPEAAALVLAAKALARAPVDHVNHASKYFLVGTLVSVLAAAAMSMAARTAVGLSAL